jgi:hypothetical protein
MLIGENMKALRFVRRRNLGPYEHSELEIHDSVEDGENAVAKIKETMDLVKDALYGTGPFASSEATPAAATPAKETPATPAKEKTTTALPKNKTTEKTTATTATPDKKEDALATATQTEMPLKEKEEPAANGKETSAKETPAKEAPAKETATAAAAPAKDTKASAPETKVKVKATKATLYDRELDAHKNQVGLWLDKAIPDWRTPAQLAKCSKASKALTGKIDLLDGNGEILESFKEKFLELVKAG